MLAPKELVATGPSTPIAAVVSRVVVVLPLVPETSAIRAAGGEVGQQVRVDQQTDPAADHRAVAAAGGPGQRGGGPRDRAGHPGAQR